MLVLIKNRTGGYMNCVYIREV